MNKSTRILPLLLLFLIGCSSYVGLRKADETWESPSVIKVRIVRKYYEGNDYFFFESLESETGRWKRIMTVWRDATGGMPVENVRILDPQVGYMVPLQRLL